MGEKPDPYEPGAPCMRCWGIGKEFGDYPTPKRLHMSGSGFVPPVEEANDTWVLTQNPVNHCLWSGQNNGLIGYYEIDAMNSLCEIKKGAVSIFQAVDVICVLEFDQGASHVSVH